MGAGWRRVRDEPPPHGAAAIVSAVSGTPLNLRLRGTAEGVETAEQFAYRRSHDSDEAHGYYFGRPVCATDLTRALART